MMYLEELTAAVELGRSDRDAGRARLSALWEATDDPGTRCAIAHYLADLQEDVDAELEWDLRALENVQDDAWLPSLHLNLADDYRRLGQPSLAIQHLADARAALPGLPEDGYGDVIRAGVEHVTEALAAGSVLPLASSPSS